ncbi:MAG: LamG-like jellyroll fold domain-containing protein [Bacteroidota bacterium]
MKKLLLLFSFLLLMAHTYAQQCSENTNVNGIAGTGHTPGNNVGQSFTACQTGLLATVSAVSGNAPTGINEFIVEIHAGEGFNGTLLGRSASIFIGANRTVTWNLRSLGIIVQAGQKYTAQFLRVRGDAQLKYSTAANPALDYYTRGRAIGIGQPHNDMFFSALIETLSAPTLNPADDATEVARSTDVKMNFSRSMEAVSGNITIENTTDATSQVVDVTTLTIDGGEVQMPIATPLLAGKDYNIIIPSGTLKANNGIPFPGISTGEWNFSTSTKPFATIATTSSDLTNDAIIPFTIDFSDVVTGFALSDLVITNGVASNIGGSGSSYTFDVTPSADGDLIVSLPPSVVEAGPSNGNDSTGYQLMYDGTAPGVALNTDVSGTIGTSIFDIEVVFTEPVTGFSNDDLQITNAEILSSSGIKDSLFTIELRALAQGQVTVNLGSAIASDLAGNDNTAAPSMIDVTYEVNLGIDLLSHYPFDGNAMDTVSTGFDGTVTGATLVTGFDGTANSAYSFDGNDQITFGDTPIGSGSYSMAFWLKIPENLPQNRTYTILSKRAACSEGRLFELNLNRTNADGNRITLEQRDNGGVSSPVASLPVENEWVHIAYVKDNSAKSSALYINGKFINSSAWTSYNAENNASLKIGISPCNGNGRFQFNGAMDNFYVYGRAITPVEVDLLVPFDISEESVVAGEDIAPGQSIELTFNKDIIQSSANTTNVTASGSTSGAVAVSVSSTQNGLIITPVSGWPTDEDVTISLANILAANGMTLSSDITYSVVSDEDAGMILHYPISGNANEVIGEIAGQNGTVSGALFVDGVDGTPFGALSFDGANDVVTLGDAPLSTESFSIAFWVKVPADGSTTNNTIILSKREACSEGRMVNLFYQRSGDKAKFTGSARSNGGAGSVSTGFDFPVEEWVHVLFVKDNGPKKYRLIINGVLESEADWALGTVNIENTAPIRLGTSPCVGADGTQRFRGELDDLRIYDRVVNPRVLTITPSNGTTDVSVDTDIAINFDRAVDTNSLEASTVNISDADGTPYGYSTVFSNGDSVLTITPDSSFPKGKTYTVKVDTLGAVIGSDFRPFGTTFSVEKTRMLAFSPANETVKVDSIAKISFKFDGNMDMNSLEGGIKIIGSQHGPVEGTFAMPANDSVVFTPSTPYFPNEKITVYVRDSLKDAGGESIANPWTFKFHVKSTVFTNPTLSYVRRTLNTGNLVTNSPRQIIPADIDGDGDLDLVGGDDDPGTLFYFENIGSGNYSEGRIIDFNNGYFDIKVTDFDFDGDQDIITVDRSVSQGVYLYVNDGSGNFSIERRIVQLNNSDSRSIVVADLQKGGDMEVAVASLLSNRFHSFDSDGNQLFAAANSGKIIFITDADWNNDGNLDIISGHFDPGLVARQTGNGAGGFSGFGLLSAGQVRSVVPIDIDEDGDMDIAYSSQNGNKIGVLQNDGSNNFTDIQVGSVIGPHRLDVGDADGDGDLDILYTTAGTGADINFHYLENSGSLTLWTSKRLILNDSYSGTFTQTATFADLDNDGDLDVVATDATGGFYVFENMIIDLNEPPLVTNPIADQTIEEDNADGLTIDVSNVFTDNEADAFTITASVDNPAVSATINGNDLEISLVTANFFGQVNITLTADDGNGTNTDMFVLEVTSVNDAPEFTLSASDITVTEEFTTTETLTVTQNQPAGEDDPTYSIAPTSVDFANVSIDANSGGITVTSLENGFGSQEFTVTANDGGSVNSTAIQTFTLTVAGVNDAPVVENAIADVTLEEDPAINGRVVLTNVFSDADGDDLTYSINVTSGEDIADVTLDVATINLAPVANAFGTVGVEVTAEDASGESVTDTFDIVINAVNDAPAFTLSQTEVTVAKNFSGTQTLSVTADAVPFGEDSQVVTYSLTPASVTFANVSIDSSTGEVSISSVADQFGSQSFTLTADDGQDANNTFEMTFTLDVVDKQQQTVTFTGVEDKIFGDESFTISGSVNSNLPITFTVISGGLSVNQNKEVIVPPANQVSLSITAAGTAVIQASNDGDDTYAPLLEEITINIAKADQLISITPLDKVSRVAEPFMIAATNSTDLPLEYAVTSGPASISGNTITLDGTLGTVIVEVTQAGTDNYNPATASVSFEVVDLESQTITFNEIADTTYGAADITLTATSSSELPVSIALISGPGSLNGQTLSITGAGEITLEATQAGNDEYLAATAVRRTFTVSEAPLTITADDASITYGDVLPAFTYQITGLVNGDTEQDLNATISIVADIGEQEVADAGTYPIIITAKLPIDAPVNYQINLVNAELIIEKADQQITIEAIEDKLVGDPDFDVIATVDSGLPLVFSLTGPATINGNTISLDGNVGTIEVTVSQEGDINRNPASETVSFEVVVPTSTGKLRADDELIVYPNPSADVIFIKAGELIESVRIISLDGQIIRESKYSETGLDISELSNGLYVIQLELREGTILKRFTKN